MQLILSEKLLKLNTRQLCEVTVNVHCVLWPIGGSSERSSFSCCSWTPIKLMGVMWRSVPQNHSLIFMTLTTIGWNPVSRPTLHNKAPLYPLQWLNISINLDAFILRDKKTLISRLPPTDPTVGCTNLIHSEPEQQLPQIYTEWREADACYLPDR